jgi:hypothetical protein
LSDKACASSHPAKLLAFVGAHQGGFAVRLKFFAMLAGLAIVGAGAVQAQQPAPKFHCGELSDNLLPKIEASFRAGTDFSPNNFACLAWQDLIYFMWPAMPNQRGVPSQPNQPAAFHNRGLTVWESYKTADAIFLPNGQDPGPWDGPQLLTTLRSLPAQQVSQGTLRHLTMTSKVSRSVLANILRTGKSMPPDILDEIAQAFGGTLYDLNGNPVYYEVAMNDIQYNYIRQNGLYDANKQIAFAQSNAIVLPAAPNTTTQGAVEVKAAWKVLTAAETLSGHFHTARALLDGPLLPVTVGLVGFHVSISNGAQGIWFTFAQVDNAPVQHPATSGTFNFFNPKCTVPGTSTPCPFNAKTNPGQVVQLNPDNATADQLNVYMHYMLKDYSPWPYYNLVDVQWANVPVPIAKLPAPQSAPLPDGQPNTPTMVNAVLETFLQQPGTSCITCHQYATVASVGKQSPNYAASYSYAFGRASPGPK